MANTSSAKKRIRRDARFTIVNSMRLKRIRTFWRKVEEAISGGDAKEAATALRNADAETQRGVTKGVLKKGMAARKISRLAQRVKKMGAATA